MINKEFNITYSDIIKLIYKNIENIQLSADEPMDSCIQKYQRDVDTPLIYDIRCKYTGVEKLPLLFIILTNGKAKVVMNGEIIAKDMLIAEDTYDDIISKINNKLLECYNNSLKLYLNEKS